MGKSGGLWGMVTEVFGSGWVIRKPVPDGR
jgi:hypothetical protein